MLQVEPSSYHHKLALDAARQLSRTYNIPMHGTVLQLVNCMPQLFTAVEVRSLGPFNSCGKKRVLPSCNVRRSACTACR